MKREEREREKERGRGGRKLKGNKRSEAACGVGDSGQSEIRGAQWNGGPEYQSHRQSHQLLPVNCSGGPHSVGFPCPDSSCGSNRCLARSALLAGFVKPKMWCGGARRGRGLPDEPFQFHHQRNRDI